MKNFNWFLAIGIIFFLNACTQRTQPDKIEQVDTMGNAGKVAVPMGLWEAELQLRSLLDSMYRKSKVVIQFYI